MFRYYAAGSTSRGPANAYRSFSGHPKSASYDHSSDSDRLRAAHMLLMLDCIFRRSRGYTGGGKPLPLPRRALLRAPLERNPLVARRGLGSPAFGRSLTWGMPSTASTRLFMIPRGQADILAGLCDIADLCNVSFSARNGLASRNAMLDC